MAPYRMKDVNGPQIDTEERRATTPARKLLAATIVLAELAVVLTGCATAGDKAAARISWGSCISDAVAALDDDKTDPVSIAYGVSPRCSVQYDRLSQIMISENITQAGQDNTRRLMREDEIRLITAAVLSRRAAHKQ